MPRNWSDTDTQWYERRWAQRAWLNHLHDPKGTYLKPTPRRCVGLEPQTDWRDSAVFYGCVVLGILLLLFGSKPGINIRWLLEMIG